MPESLAGYGGCGADLAAELTGGFGAGRVGIRFKSLAGGCGPVLPFGTGGGALGFSKLPSWLTVGNRGLAGGLISGDIEVYVDGIVPGDVGSDDPIDVPESPRRSVALAS
jgi:hypothetical protein